MPRRGGAAARSRREARCALALGSLVLASCCLLLPGAFVGLPPRAGTPRGHSAVALHSAAEYKGFVPDMQRRTLMNLVMVGATAVPILAILFCWAQYFVPPSAGGSGGATIALDEESKTVSFAEWVKNHKSNDRELVQGLKGDATYLISTENGVKDFGLNAVCTHLGCVVPWVRANNRFICPCHGSNYDENGKVVRGPAPLSLALVHTEIQEDSVFVKPWKETDFRTGEKPWWDA